MAGSRAAGPGTRCGVRVQCAGVRGVRSMRALVAGGGGHGWRGGVLGRRIPKKDVSPQNCGVLSWWRCGVCAGETRVKAKGKKHITTIFHTQEVTLYTQLLPRAACALCHIFMGTLKGSHRRCWLPRRADERRVPRHALAVRCAGAQRPEDRARQRGQRPKRGQRPVGRRPVAFPDPFIV